MKLKPRWRPNWGNIGCLAFLAACWALIGTACVTAWRAFRP